MNGYHERSVVTSAHVDNPLRGGFGRPRKFDEEQVRFIPVHGMGYLERRHRGVEFEDPRCARFGHHYGDLG